MKKKKIKSKKIKVKHFSEVDQYIGEPYRRIIKHQLLYWEGKGYGWKDGVRYDFVLVK